MKHEAVNLPRVLLQIFPFRLQCAIRQEFQLHAGHISCVWIIRLDIRSYHTHLASVVLVEQIGQNSAVFDQLGILPSLRVRNGNYAFPWANHLNQRSRRLCLWDRVNYGLPVLREIIMAEMKVIAWMDRVNQPGDFPQVADNMIRTDRQLRKIIPNVALRPQQGRTVI